MKTSWGVVPMLLSLACSDKGTEAEQSEDTDHQGAEDTQDPQDTGDPPIDADSDDLLRNSRSEL